MRPFGLSGRESFCVHLVALAWVASNMSTHAIGNDNPEQQQGACVEEPSSSYKPARANATGGQPEDDDFEHPDGTGKWTEWGIEPTVLTRGQRDSQRLMIGQLLTSQSAARAEVLHELTGERTIEKARPLLKILGVESLPRKPKREPSRLGDEALGSVEGFVISSALETRPRDLNPDRVAYTHVTTGERVRLNIIYDESPADAFCRLVDSSWMMFAAPLELVLPTCRIKNGPGDLCWLGWSRTNEEHTLYFPSDADVLFIRGGAAVLLRAQDSAKHDFVMELAGKIDALLLSQQAAEDQIEHPDGSGKWQEWGIKPRTLTREERFKQGSIIDNLLGPRSEVRRNILLELAGKKDVDKARPILDILGVDSLPHEPAQRATPLSEDALRSLEGFELLGGWIASSPEMRRAGASRDKLIYTHVGMQKGIGVYIFYDESPAGALRQSILLMGAESSAPLSLVLPTCRIRKGPGDFCWLAWNQSNKEHTIYFPYDGDIFFIRGGVAVRLALQDHADRDFVMDLARKIDALLLKQGGRPREHTPDAPGPTDTRQWRTSGEAK